LEPPLAFYQRDLALGGSKERSKPFGVSTMMGVCERKRDTQREYKDVKRMVDLTLSSSKKGYL
jgi:hypothetical protein